jgi:PAS domain S-box-containing protein
LSSTGIADRVKSPIEEAAMRKKVDDSPEDAREEDSISVDEEKYRFIFENAPIGLVHYDEKGVIRECNRNLEVILGSSREKLIGLDMLNRLDNEDVLRALKESLEGRPGYYEGEYVSVTGSKRSVVRMRFRQMRDEKGKSIGGVGIIEDVTERVGTEVSLKGLTRRLSILNDVISAANKAENLHQLLCGCLESVIKRMEYDGGGIYLVDAAARVANVVCDIGLPADFLDAVRRVRIDAKPYSRVLVSGELLITDQYGKLFPGDAKDFPFRSLISVPLVWKGEVIGALNVISAEQKDVSAEERDLLMSVGAELGGAIRKMRIEDVLRENEERYRMLFQSASDAVFVHQLTAEGYPTKFIEVNDVACARLGYSRDELLGMTPMDIESPDSGAGVRAAIDRLGAEKHVTYEAQHITRSTRRIDVEVSSHVFELKGRKVVVSLARDITDRKRNDQIMRASEAKFRSLFDSIKDCVFFADLDGRIRDANGAFLGATGFEMHELVGKDFRSLMPSRPRLEMDEALRAKVMEAGDSGERDLEFTRKDGTAMPVSVRVWLIRDGAGEPAGLWAFARDVTSQRSAEEEVKRRMGEIEKLNKFMIGRELRIIEMKREVNAVLARLGQPPKYGV